MEIDCNINKIKNHGSMFEFGFTIYLDKVISVNHSHTGSNNTHKRIKSKEYRSFQGHLDFYCRSITAKATDFDFQLVNCVEMQLLLYYRQNRFPDIDNFAKPILDTLQGWFYPNDRLIRSIEIARFEKQGIERKYELYISLYCYIGGNDGAKPTSDNSRRTR